jgi:ParB family chromosome partitioning protein
MALVDTTLSVDEIKVGTRIRKEPGDLASLADSIGRLGLLHPVVVAPTHELLAGWRRLEAMKLLGWTSIPARIAMDVADYSAALAIESDENAERKDFTHSEAVAMARAIESFEKPRARDRQRSHGGTAPGRNTSEDSAEVKAPRPRDVASRATGRSHDTLRKAAAIIDIAEDTSQPDEVRAVASAAQAQMDATGKVDPAYRATQAAIGAHIAEANPGLVDLHLSTEAGKAVRKFKGLVKTIDPERAAAGLRATSEHMDLHVESVDECLAWLTTYRRGLTPLALVREGN